jgi:hypothetical protein
MWRRRGRACALDLGQSVDGVENVLVTAGTGVPTSALVLGCA